MAKSMNILIVVNSLDKGGRTKRIIQEMQGLTHLNHHVTLAVFEEPPEWVRQRHPGNEHWLILEKQPGKFDLKLLKKIMRTLNALDIDIIHSHCEASALYAGVAAKLKHVPIVGTFHRSNLEFYQPSLKNKLSAWLLNHCIAISTERMQRMHTQLGIKESKITLIHGGVELDEVSDSLSKESLAAKLGITGRALFSAGHLGPIKGHDDSIEALALIQAKHPQLLENVHLYIAGDGSEQDYSRLKTRIEQHQLKDKVSLLGQISNIMEWMQACEFFLQPSREEGFGLVFIEAGLCHKPTIATHVGGIPDIIIDGQTGYLVEAEQPAQLADKITRLLSNDALATQLGEQAYQRTIECFLLEKQIEKLEKVYCGLL